MNVESLVRDTLREQAAGQRAVEPGFADRVLAVRRRRRRVRGLASVAAVVTTVIAIAVGVPLLDSGRDSGRHEPPAAGNGISAHPDQSPPRDLIAAGDVALAAYYTAETVERTAGEGVSRRTYWLLDPATGRYEKDDRWSYVAVAPGMRTAAVLERDLPADRIGILDLATGDVDRWVKVGHGVGGLAYSRDGGRIVATTYDENPDLRVRVQAAEGGGEAWMSESGGTSRTGFLVLDVVTDESTWSAVPAGRDVNAREDFAFSRTGQLVYSRVVGERDGLQRFYDLSGAKTAAPADERYLRSDVPARLSPDGRLAALGLAKERKDTSWSSIRDPRTGEEVTEVRGATLLAWADDRRLIAWERAPGVAEYRPRLVLVTLGSDEVTQLSGTRVPDDDFDRQEWEPVFVTR
ncbi:WD40 repeat domain-containing protein [Streptomyces sp. ISL-12]|uniref:WD40 repeat domain-containing protein n=1 Tax=Streptomyces sp. ISL-12 TaxID=2819177 RepID=UPI001BE63D3E|nr:WD40 repeat domain-containing protein [Streptomyces sp. ISL-12]MBT2410023.1 WD40 repeat domain-containing protein [Streptomyces sp. ISL-12]